ncbi:hypothetical protein [Dapis sp. BLCC M172]|uniref:hypothetical protein n=1 Tax=Dapis sp. BLCC M172 TaxID=2975281 RepID=UPI003CEC1B6D
MASIEPIWDLFVYLKWGVGSVGSVGSRAVWRDGEMGRWGVLDICHSSHHQINYYPFFIN